MKRTLPLMILSAAILTACTTTVRPTETVAPSIEIPAAVPSLAVANTPTNADLKTTTSTPTGVVTFNIVPAESKVTYEVGETFFNQNNRFNLAIGVTRTLSGSIFADLSNPPASRIGPVEVDISQFKSDSTRRDNAIRGDWLESTRFPIATYESTAIEGLPESYREGQDYTLKVIGNLTVRDITLPVTFEVTTRLAGDTLTGSAVTTIRLSDFGVGPISIVGILKTEDTAKITLEFVARP